MNPNYLIFHLFLISIHAFAQKENKDYHDVFEQGVNYWQARHYDKAADAMSEVISLKPSYYEAYLYRAASKVQLQNLSAAFLDYSIYTTAFPEDAEALFSYSVVAYELERFQEAKKGFMKLLLMPKGATTTVFFRKPAGGGGVDKVFTAQSSNQAYLLNYMGLAEHGLEHYQLAIDYYDSALSSTDDADILMNRALSYQALGNIDKAIEDMELVLVLEPNHALAKYNLALLYEQSGDNDKTEAYFSESIQDNPASPYGYRQRGFKRLESGQYKTAIDDFSDAIRLAPKDADTWLNRGVAYEKDGQLNNAFNDYTKVVELSPDYAKAYLNRGNVSIRLEEYKNALDDYNVAIIYDREYGLAYYQRGIAHYRLGDNMAACNDLSKAVELGVDPAAKVRKKVCSSSVSH
ncbi:tetratricopeptide repeat protein [Fulvivirga maritima]|uniref:tetratricopeptide repeat protein n=1 Tax=Fulvivirga maritima TaxID=2904247 RepID=UPI001F2C3108|nr:tetratricopeptide repeat protein [Fulvivirga maritima]UII25044.1 tetratricopeptide repeat protein [Fulvivirga maritima]